jgi:hypothetical protein
MSKLRFFMSTSLDGFVAGPDQSAEDPLGVGGLQLHEWIFPLAAWREGHGEEGGEVNASTPVWERRTANIGALARLQSGSTPARADTIVVIAIDLRDVFTSSVRGATGRRS